MAEYIKREELLKSIGHIPEGVISDYDAGRWDVAQLVKEVPSADVVEVRHGEWIEGKSLEKCSLCGKKGFPDWKYCPHCGAKMDGRREK
jgi:hypothetical protein